MIRVRRPEPTPAILVKDGATRLDELCVAVSSDATVTFDRDVYAAPEVKATLVSAQHGKCCFCESKVQHVASGDIEHFRPKAAVYLDGEATLSKPGYYWLAYEWTNLLFACEQCNRRGKKNHFPLIDEEKRVRSPSVSLHREQPMFVDPAAEDPQAHIGFREAYAFGRTPRGEATWKALDLNRVPLLTRRGDRLRELRRLEDVVKVLKRRRSAEATQLLGSARDSLNAAVAENAEYAGMWRAALAEKPP